jgi:hypothetical protein
MRLTGRQKLLEGCVGLLPISALRVFFQTMCCISSSSMPGIGGRSTKTFTLPFAPGMLVSGWCFVASHGIRLRSACPTPSVVGRVVKLLVEDEAGVRLPVCGFVRPIVAGSAPFRFRCAVERSP